MRDVKWEVLKNLMEIFLAEFFEIHFFDSIFSVKKTVGNGILVYIILVISTR